MYSELQFIKNKIDKYNKFKEKGLNIFPLINKAKRIVIQGWGCWGANIIVFFSFLIIGGYYEFFHLSEFWIFIIMSILFFLGWVVVFVIICLINLVLIPLILLIFIFRRFISYLKIKGLIKKYIYIRLSEYQSQGYDISELKELLK